MFAQFSYLLLTSQSFQILWVIGVEVILALLITAIAVLD